MLQLIAVSSVSERSGDELLVRYHEVIAAERLQSSRMHAYLPQGSGAAVFQLDVVADGEAAVERDDELEMKFEAIWCQLTQGPAPNAVAILSPMKGGDRLNEHT